MTAKPYETRTAQVPLAAMVVDDRVQRGLVEKHVTHIVKNFDPSRVGTLHVSHRSNGTHAIIDGQHRVVALQRLGYETWKAEIYTDLTLQEEADLFVWLNNTRHIRQIDKFRTRATSNDPVVRDILDIVRKTGWEIPLMGETTAGNGKITATAALLSIYNAHVRANPDDIFAGRYGLERVLSLLAEAWGYKDPNIVNTNMLRGFDLFLRRYKDLVNKQTLISRLKDYPGGPRRFLANARGLAAISSDAGQSLASAVAWQLTDAYNWRLSAHRLEAWRR